jgi:hypothetical protein
VKNHSIYVEERTVYVCSCKAEFGNIREAESHMRNPPHEKAKTPRPARPAKPKKLAPAPRRTFEPRTITLPNLDMPESGQ